MTADVQWILGDQWEFLVTQPPVPQAFEGGSYEIWFGEHSYLTARAAEIIQRESLDILRCLRRAAGLP